MHYKVTTETIEPCVLNDFKKSFQCLEIVTQAKCPICGDLMRVEWAEEHVLSHSVDKRIMELWNEGKTLLEINDAYHMFDHIYRDIESSYDSFCQCHHNITKDSCFKISYLQCCDYPAYRISDIDSSGRITVWGIGGWSGGYASQVKLGCLRDPRPLSELYIHPKYK